MHDKNNCMYVPWYYVLRSISKLQAEQNLAVGLLKICIK